MSRSSLIIGLLVAIGLHAVLFGPSLWTDTPPETPDRPTVPPVAITPPPEPQSEPEPAPTPPSEPVRQPAPPTPPPPTEKPAPPLREVHQQPTEADPPPEEGDTHATPAEDVDDSDLPPLRIVWDSPAELRRVAGQLGLRIVAVNAAGEILGEVPSEGPVKLVEFTGQLSRYSNRVRTLPVRFFGGQLTRSTRTRRLWVLVPADLDQRWIRMQKRVIAQAGVELAGVRELEGQFRAAGDGLHLVVTRIRQSVN
ncbi:MAG: hypothetical protein ACOCZU_03680 [Planctomycetota bacterium]